MAVDQEVDRIITEHRLGTGPTTSGIRHRIGRSVGDWLIRTRLDEGRTIDRLEIVREPLDELEGEENIAEVASHFFLLGDYAAAIRRYQHADRLVAIRAGNNLGLSALLRAQGAVMFERDKSKLPKHVREAYEEKERQDVTKLMEEGRTPLVYAGAGGHKEGFIPISAGPWFEGMYETSRFRSGKYTYAIVNDNRR